MSIGAQPAETWQHETGELVDPPADQAEGESLEEFSEPPTQPSWIRDRLPALLLAVLGLGWVAAVFWAALHSLYGRAFPLGELLGWIAMASGPLALIGVFYVLLGRTSRREARRFVRTAQAMRGEAAALERMIAALTVRI